MTTFQTPEAISVSLDFGIGDVRLLACDPGETVVEVRPTDPAKKGDVEAATQTLVEYTSGALLVRGPKNWRQWTPWGVRDSIDVEIRLPEGSRVSAEVQMAAVHAAGRLGELDIKTGMGDVRLDEVGPVRIRSGFGEVIIGRVEGEADLKTGSGRIEIGSVEGSATVKNSNGDTRIRDVGGRAQIQSANGTIQVDHAHSDVTAKTAIGDVRLGALSQGTIEAKTGFGQIEIGVLDGVAAWLDLSTGFGRVNNELEETGRPPADEQTTQISAHTAIGDINVRRVTASQPAVARTI
jgi:Putative adhesin